MKDLSKIREEIDQIDRQMVALYEARMNLAAEVAEYKISVGKPVLDKGREKRSCKKCRGWCRQKKTVMASGSCFSKLWL